MHQIHSLYFLKRFLASWWAIPEWSSSNALVKLSFTMAFCMVVLSCSARSLSMSALRTALVCPWMSTHNASTVLISVVCGDIVVIIIRPFPLQICCKFSTIFWERKTFEEIFIRFVLKGICGLQCPGTLFSITPPSLPRGPQSLHQTSSLFKETRLKQKSRRPTIWLCLNSSRLGSVWTSSHCSHCSEFFATF